MTFYIYYAVARCEEPNFRLKHVAIAKTVLKETAWKMTSYIYYAVARCEEPNFRLKHVAIVSCPYRNSLENDFLHILRSSKM